MREITDNMMRVLENTDLSHLTRVRLSGGEPFLAKNIDRFMEIIPTEQIDFSVNTNGTVVYPLPKFKSVNIELSIDATGDLFESMRYPQVGQGLKEHETMGETRTSQYQLHSVSHERQPHTESN